MKTMKVAMYYNNNDVRIEEMPIPTINEDELLVKVQASGICGSDVMEWYRLKKAPLVLGHEITGDIVKVGKNVKGFAVGDRVFVSHHVPCNNCFYCQKNQHTLCHTLHSTNFYPGGFAEFLKVPKINVKNGTFLLPKKVSYEEGAFIEPLACVVRGFQIAEMKPEQSILVIGCGQGRLAEMYIALAKKMGVKEKTHWVIADIGVVKGTFDTVLQNPPFGVQRRRADRRFISKSLELSGTIYSFHKGGQGNREFIKRFIEEHGGKVTTIFPIKLEIPRMFKFHTKKKKITQVDLYRIEGKVYDRI